MRNFIASFIIFTALFAGCKKESVRAFDQSPEERVNEILNKYQTQLVGAQNGWKAFVETELGGTYFFYFKFNDKNRVKMYSTFDSASAVTSMESSYRLKALQQVSLLFDTYSYLHVLSDPDPSTAGGSTGEGYGADFEYLISDSSSADTIKLIGRKNGTKTKLVRATQAEEIALDNKGLANGFLIKNINSFKTYFKRIVLAGVTYEILTNLENRSVTFRWLENGELKSQTVFFYYSPEGIAFLKPFTNGTLTVNGFTNLTWNPAIPNFGFSINGTATTVTAVAQPLKVELNTPRDWWDFANNNSGYWGTLSGFNVGGVEDFYKVKSIAGFAFLQYFTDYVALPGGRGDALRINGTGAGVIFSSPPTFTSDGRVRFVNSGYQYGTPPTPLIQTRNKMTEITGYYLIKTGPESYDMVNAADGTAWITWVQ